MVADILVVRAAILISFLRLPIHAEFWAVLDTIKHGHLVFIAGHGGCRVDHGQVDMKEVQSYVAASNQKKTAKAP